MRRQSQSTPYKSLLILLTAALFTSASFGQSLKIRKTAGSFWVDATAPAEVPSTLQVSHNMNLWVDVQDVASDLVSVPVNIDNDGPRYYRLRPTVEPSPDIRVMVLGDSMAADCCGWGAGLYDYFKPNATVLNYAIPHATTKTFLLSEQYQGMLVVKPDYVFIQFAWVDATPQSVDPEAPTPEQFKANLGAIIQSIRGFNGVPFLVTMHTHRVWFDQLLWPWDHPYNDLIRQVASEQNVQLLDLWNVSRDVVYKLGPTGSAFLNLKPDDFNHLSPLGAKYYSRMFLRILPDNFGPYLQGIYDPPPPP